MNIYLKFGSKENSLDFLENGTVYCSPIIDFIKYDDGCRNDKDERTTLILNNKINSIHGCLISNPEIKFKFTQINNSVYKEHIEDPLHNIYCLFGFNLHKATAWKEYLIHDEMRGFGEYFVLIHNSEEFVKRLKKKLELTGFKYEHRAIEYVDYKKLNGKKNLFQKDIKFAYQNEVRILIKTGLKESFKLKLDSIEDIATLYNISEYDTFIKYVDENGSRPLNKKAIYLRENI